MRKTTWDISKDWRHNFLVILIWGSVPPFLSLSYIQDRIGKRANRISTSCSVDYGVLCTSELRLWSLNSTLLPLYTKPRHKTAVFPQHYCYSSESDLAKWFRCYLDSIIPPLRSQQCRHCFLKVLQTALNPVLREPVLPRK